MRRRLVVPTLLPLLGLTLVLGFVAGCGGEPKPEAAPPAPSTGQADPGPATAGKDIKPIRGR